MAKRRESDFDFGRVPRVAKAAVKAVGSLGTAAGNAAGRGAKPETVYPKPKNPVKDPVSGQAMRRGYPIDNVNTPADPSLSRVFSDFKTKGVETLGGSLARVGRTAAGNLGGAPNPRTPRLGKKAAGNLGGARAATNSPGALPSRRSGGGGSGNLTQMMDKMPHTSGYEPFGPPRKKR